MLRGPDSAEWKGDLAKVEQRLQRLKADDTLLSAERDLEKLYFNHRRKKLRYLLAKQGISPSESGQGPEDPPGISLNDVCSQTLAMISLGVMAMVSSMCEPPLPSARHAGVCFQWKNREARPMKTWLPSWSARLESREELFEPERESDPDLSLWDDCARACAELAT